MSGFEEWEDILEAGESVQGDITGAELDSIGTDLNFETRELPAMDQVESKESSNGLMEALRREGLLHKIRFFNPRSRRRRRTLARSGSK